MAIPPADMVQDQHDEDSGAKKGLLYGHNTSGDAIPITVNDDGSFK